MKKLLASLLVIGFAFPAMADDWSGSTFSQVKSELDSINNILATQRDQALRGKVMFSSCITAMTALSNKYGGANSLVNATQALVNSDPTNPALINLQADLNQYLADRSLLLTGCTNLESAVSGITP